MAKWPTKQQEVHFATNLRGFLPDSQHIEHSVVVVVVVLFIFVVFCQEDYTLVGLILIHAKMTLCDIVSK